MAKFPSPTETQSPFDELNQPDINSGRGLSRRWLELTSIGDAPPGASFELREKARQSMMTSIVLGFYLIMLVALLPACYIAGYLTYFWLDLGLTIAAVIGLVFNRFGFIILAGLIVTLAGFVGLTIALFSISPFPETALQGFDMYGMVIMFAASMLPSWSIFVVLVASDTVIIIALYVFPRSKDLLADMQTSAPLILLRPIGTLAVVAIIAFIITLVMKNAIRRAGQAETIARLEHALSEERQRLEEGVRKILDTHVQIANGNLSARAPLDEQAQLYQIASALNILLDRYKRFAQSSQVHDQLLAAIQARVQDIQKAQSENKNPHLLPTNTSLDALISALQGVTIDPTILQRYSPQASRHYSEPSQRRP